MAPVDFGVTDADALSYRLGDQGKEGLGPRRLHGRKPLWVVVPRSIGDAPAGACI